LGLLEDALKRAIARRGTPVQADNNRAERAREEATLQQQQRIDELIGQIPTLLEEAIYSGKHFIEVVTIDETRGDYPPDWWLDYCHFFEAQKYIDDHPVAKAVCDFMEEAQRQRFVFSLHLKPLPDDPNEAPNRKAIVVHAAWR
jgi:hypothetical protein